MKKVTVLFLSLTLSVGVWATDGVHYFDAYGQEKIANGVNQVQNASELVTWGAEGTTTWYVVKGDVQTQTIVCNGDVHLILADGAKLTATGSTGRAGIQVSGESNSLAIYGQSAQSGQLIANGGGFGAGIGGGIQTSGSNITICGGTITAKGGVQAAGIGGGEEALAFNITIHNGFITAIAGESAVSAIGSGAEARGSSHSIFVNAGLLIKSGNPPEIVIANTRTNTTDIATDLNGSHYITITDGNSGDGTKTAPFLIHNYDELLEFSKQVNGGKNGSCARLEADIDASGRSDWEPIGGGYAGTFNGNGHVIKNLTFKSDAQRDGVGLFGKMGTGGEVYGVGIVDGHFEGRVHVGAICGDFATGAIYDCYAVNTYVKGSQFANGGLVGSCYYNAVLRDCYIRPHSDYDQQTTALICGDIYGTITHCYYISDSDMDSSIYKIKRNSAAIIEVTRVSVADAKSGKLCDLLNHYGSNGSHWYQTLGSDESPVVDFSHGIVEWNEEKFINRSRENVEIIYFTSDNEPITLRGGFGSSELMGNYITKKNGVRRGLIVCDQPITKIDAYTFAQDSTLTAITLPSSLYRIGNNAFASCASLGEIVLGENVESIGEEAFMGCDALETAYIYAVQPPQLGSDGLGTGTAIHVIDASLYKQAEGWKDLNIVGDADMMKAYKTARKDELIQATGASTESGIPSELKDKYKEYVTAIDKATTVADIDAVCVKAIAELQEMAQRLSWKDNGETMINY